MTSVEKYAGFPEHLERYLGHIREAGPPTAGSRARGYMMIFCVNASGELVSVVTNGMRHQKVRVQVPQELVCTAYAEHEKAALFLLSITAEQVIRAGTGLVQDQVVLGDSPVIPKSRIHGVIACTHPYVDGAFETLQGRDGSTELQLLTLVPVTAAEGQLARTRGPGALYDHWAEQETDLLDIFRRSSV